MKPYLFGVLSGALTPILLALAGEWLKRRRQRRQSMRYLRRRMIMSDR